MANPTRWAIAGAGKISGNFAAALNLAPKSEHLLAAVAARSLDRAEEFAKTHSIPKAYGSYEDMVKDVKNNKIDVVYIGTVHPTHKPICELFINASIPVLCEKPMTVNAREAKAVFDLAREKNVFVMEGFWSRFFPAYIELNKELEAGIIGEPNFVSSNFCRNLHQIPDYWVMNKDEAAGGSLLALGCYNIQLAQMVFKYEKPERIIATGIINDTTGVDEFVSATLVYSNNRMAVLTSSLCTSADPMAVIGGNLPCAANISKGQIKVPFLLAPTELITPEGTKHFPLKNVSPVPLKSKNAEGMVYEADAVRDCLLKGMTQHPLCTWDQTLQHMEILDEIRRQIGLVYKWDNV